jgi:hypothetical protein
MIKSDYHKAFLNAIATASRPWIAVRMKVRVQK